MAQCAYGGQRTVGGIMSSFTCGSQGVAAVIGPNDRRFTYKATSSTHFLHNEMSLITVFLVIIIVFEESKCL